MFTGLVQTLVPVTQMEILPSLIRYHIGVSDQWINGLLKGASVAIGGVCQTVVDCILKPHGSPEIVLEAIQETLERTTLGAMQVGTVFNFERAMRLGDEVGGHFVSGHVTGRLQILERQTRGHEVLFRLKCSQKEGRFLFQKGFIALDGVSLTVGEVDPQQGLLTIHCIPETLQRTTWGKRQPGDWVNVEWDHQTQVIVETLERMFVKSSPEKP